MQAALLQCDWAPAEVAQELMTMSRHVADVVVALWELVFLSVQWR